MAWTEQQTAIHAALNQLMKACDLSGESGSETMFGVLAKAIGNVDWGIVEQSHCDGIGCDVNALLTNAIIEVQRPDATSPEPETDEPHEPTKVEQIMLIAALVSEFEREERECYCPGCFADFIDDNSFENDGDEPAAPDGSRHLH